MFDQIQITVNCQNKHGVDGKKQQYVQIKFLTKRFKADDLSFDLFVLVISFKSAESLRRIEIEYFVKIWFLIFGIVLILVLFLILIQFFFFVFFFIIVVIVIVHNSAFLVNNTIPNKKPI